MSLLEDELEGHPLAGEEESDEPALRSPARLTAFRRGFGGFLVPVLTTLIAFLAGGLIVLATGHNPLSTYTSIFEKTAGSHPAAGLIPSCA